MSYLLVQNDGKIFPQTLPFKGCGHTFFSNKDNKFTKCDSKTHHLLHKNIKQHNNFQHR